MVARLGEGKWHIVRVISVRKGVNTVHTSCRLELTPFESSLRKVPVEIDEHGRPPTCKHCLRLRMKEIIG